MSEHLTERELTAWLSGVAGARQNSHLAACPACSEALVARRQALASFQTSVKAWSEEEFSSLQPLVRPIPTCAPARSRMPVYAAALAFSLAAAVFTFSQHRSPVAPLRPATESDSSLLDEVQASVARQVPQGLEPLRQLVVPDQNRPARGSTE